MTCSAIWTTVDDLLLKNSIEAGGSLISLAKGAIGFSRKYSYKELQDRWQVLLYDPDVSAVASTSMHELELSGTCPSTKSIKSEHFKACNDFPEMRKRGSIRKQYYAMRKKSRVEFFSSADLLFLDIPPLHESDNQGFISREHDDESFIPNDLELQEDDLDILRSVFPETLTGYASSSHFRAITNEYPAECTIAIGNDCQNGILRNEFPLDFSNPVREDETVSPMEAAAPRCIDISHGIRNSVPSFGKGEAFKAPDLVQVLPSKMLSRSLEEKQLSTTDSSHDNSQSTCGFRETHNFDFPSSEGNSSLQLIGFPSPHPDFPLWNDLEDCLATSTSVCIRDQAATHVTATMLPDDFRGKGESVTAPEIVHSVPFFGVDECNTEFMNSSVVSDSDFMDLPESLLNFANEDEMTFMGANEQDAVDETLTDYLPTFVQQEDKVESEPAILMVEEPRIGVFNCTPIASFPQNEQTIVCHVDDNAPSSVINEKEASTSGIRTDFHEPDCSVICCTMNTVDLEVPCNDDIFLLIHPSSAFPSSPPSSGDALDKTTSAIGEGRKINISIKGKDNLDSLPWHSNLRSRCSQDIHLGNLYPDYVVKSKSTDPKVPPVNASKPPASSNHYISSKGFPDRLPGDNFSRPQDEGTMASLEEMPFCAEGGLLKEQTQQQAINGAASDPEESQSDEDLPCTSEVETMILEMDLDPPGEENPISMQNRLSGKPPGVRYLPEDITRTVMRLEQCAQAVMRRKLSLQGAFAMLYGRRLKHYIKKTEVVLGRSTDDVDIDIDLSKERRANKLSRRQAIIKMEADGSFSLKNIGRSTISVNGKPAFSGQRLILSSGCLIEIAGMSFVFDINKKYIRRYIDICRQV